MKHKLRPNQQKGAKLSQIGILRLIFEGIMKEHGGVSQDDLKPLSLLAQPYLL